MKKIIRQSILLISLIFGAITAFTQVNVEVQLDSNNLLVGDQTYFHIRLTHPNNIEVLFPSSAELGETVEVLEYGKVDSFREQSNLVFQQDLLITAWDSGQHQIQKIPIAYRSLNNKPDISNSAFVYDTVYSNPIVFNVHTIAIKDTSLVAPIKAIEEEPLAFEDFLPFIYVGLGAGVLLLILLALLKNKRKEKEPEPEPIVIRPAHEVAMEQLAVLEKEELWQKGEVKTYQSKLTHIVREYLENRYEIQALESTTNEILRQLNNEDIPVELRTKIREMLNVADLVKFAKAKPPETLNKDLMEDAMNFVNTTKKIEIVEEEEGTEE